MGEKTRGAEPWATLTAVLEYEAMARSPKIIALVSTGRMSFEPGKGGKFQIPAKQHLDCFGRDRALVHLGQGCSRSPTSAGLEVQIRMQTQ